jgi:hypothetical protein
MLIVPSFGMKLLETYERWSLFDFMFYAGNTLFLPVVLSSAFSFEATERV